MCDKRIQSTRQMTIPRRDEEMPLYLWKPREQVPDQVRFPGTRSPGEKNSAAMRNTTVACSRRIPPESVDIGQQILFEFFWKNHVRFSNRRRVRCNCAPTPHLRKRQRGLLPVPVRKVELKKRCLGRASDSYGKQLAIASP